MSTETAQQAKPPAAQGALSVALPPETVATVTPNALTLRDQSGQVVAVIPMPAKPQAPSWWQARINQALR